MGNKSDVDSSMRAVTKAEGEALAAQYNIDFYETSALENNNVNTAFFNIINQVYDQLCIEQKEQEQNKGKTNNNNKNSNTVILEKDSKLKKMNCCIK